MAVPPVAVAPVLTAAGVAPPPPPAISTMRSFLADARNDPHQGNYAGVDTAVSNSPLINNNPTDPAALRAVIFTETQRNITTYVIHVGDVANNDDPGHLQLIYNIAEYTQQLGAAQNPHFGQAYFSSGEITRRQVGTYVFLQTYTNQCNQVQRMDPDAFFAAMQANMGPPLTGPHNPADAGTQTTRTRQVAFVPFCYAEYLLTPRKPIDAFMHLWPLIVANNHQDDCKGFIEYLMVSLTRPAAGAAPVTKIGMPRAASLTPELINDRFRYLTRDCPGLCPRQHHGTGRSRHCQSVGECGCSAYAANCGRA